MLRAISKLPEGDVKQLQGNDGLFRLRVGTYRVIYTIDNNRLVITVIDAGNRGQVYQNY
ncbi:type II toxin-antitoxin system RelE family toxin [Butyricicoccus intestinisimiae]|uniref:type II toxin-antitoxin system RelE family toxin n=1 Tax=Butyricicoccus intestinisimiae TaxID=2841509 RepID=UPI002ED49F5E